MDKRCQELLEHVAGCETCKSEILLDKENMLKLPQEVVDRIAIESLNRKR